jgi:hypothetical protein
MFAELSRVCDRLSLAEGSLSLKSKAVSFAKSALQWISLIDTKFGETDHETFMTAIVESHLLLGGLLLDSSSTALGINGLVPESSEPDGFEIALIGLKVSSILFAECQGARTNTVEASRELMENSCVQVRDLILNERKSKSEKRRVKSANMKEYHEIYHSFCSETAPLEQGW